MRYLTIKVIRDEMIGELGFKLIKNGMPNNGEEFIGGQGLIIAHDIIEHQQGLEKIGTLEDELIACGGVIFVRVNTGNLGNPFHSGEASVTYDISRMYSYFNDRTYFSGEKYYPKRIIEEWEWAVDEVIKASKKQIREDDEFDGDFKRLNTYLQWTKHLLRYGAYKAELRFGCSFDAYNMFKRIQDAVDVYEPEWEGQEFTLGYSRTQAIMKPKEIEEDWY